MGETAILAGGCFWGMESRFQRLAGVLDTEVGYTGGFLEDPTYRQVCQDITGHVEAVKVEFDPAVINYRAILEAFFSFHDPTLCRDNCTSQSSQYGSIIFPLDEEQKLIARAVLDEISASGEYDCAVDTIIQPATTFYPAEEYHQDYYKKHHLEDLDDLTC
jgi:methionine-S-sulfoxide reductase